MTRPPGRNRIGSRARRARPRSCWWPGRSHAGSGGPPRRCPSRSRGHSATPAAARAAHSRALCLIRSPTQSDAPRIATIATATGKLTTDESPEARRLPLEERNEPRGHPQRHDQPGQAVDPGKGDQDGGQEGQARPETRMNSQRPRRGQTRTTPHPAIPAPGKQRGSRAGSARRSGGSSCRDDPGRTSACGARSCPLRASPRPARTRPTRAAAK